MNNKLACMITTLCLSASLPLYADSEDYSNQDVSGMDFSGKSMNSSKWQNTRAVGTNFTSSNLRGANFTSADLSNADFTGCTAAYAYFNDAIITNANFSNFDNAYNQYDYCSMRCLYNTKSYKDKNLQGINFSYNGRRAFGDIDLRGQNLTGCSFYNTSVYMKNPYHSSSYGSPEYYITKFKDAIIKNVDFRGSGLTLAQLASTMSYKNKDLSGVLLDNLGESYLDFCDFNLSDTILNMRKNTYIAITNSVIKGAFIEGTTNIALSKSYRDKNLCGINISSQNLVGVNLSDQNLQNMTARTVNSELDLTGTSFKGADLRGATFGTDVSTKSSVIKNTIWTDGEIKNFAMESVDDSLTIRKYIPATSDGTTINAKIVEDATISGGAVLTLEEGAVLEISAGKTLTVSDNGEIVFDVDAAADDTNIILNSGSKLVFGDNSKLTINLTGEVSETDPLHFTVIKAADDSYVLGLDTLPKDNIILNVNGTAYDSSKWGINFDPTTGNLDISVNVPEPATYAIIFAVLALGFAAYRRRK